MTWLGLDWDGDAVFQFARAKRHAAGSPMRLLAQGDAYKCYATPEELTALRESQKAAGKPMRYDGRWRDRAPADAPDGVPFVVRLKAPKDGATTIDDQVQGSITVQNAEIDDFVLLRSDGTPTYMLAVVVDDHDMGVTHVIRGDDHLNNAFRQLPIIKAMGWPIPVYAHVPMIHGNDGGKLSKRHGAVGVEYYRDELGILPEALGNYLLRLGWGHGDDEIISREQATEWFDLAGVGKSPSRFDLKKLENLNGHYIRSADNARLAELVIPRLGFEPTEQQREMLRRSMESLKPRAANLLDLTSGAAFLFRTRPLEMDRDAASLLEGDAPALLARLHTALDALDHWDAGALEEAVRRVAEDSGGQARPGRAAAARAHDRSPENLAGDFRCARIARARRESLGPDRRPDWPSTVRKEVDRRAMTANSLDATSTESRLHGDVGQRSGPTLSISANYMRIPGCSPTIPASPRPRHANPR